MYWTRDDDDHGDGDDDETLGMRHDHCYYMNIIMLKNFLSGP